MAESRENGDGPPSRVTLAAVLTVFLPFAGGYYLSYLYRVVGAVIADRLQRDVGLGAADLGVLTSAYFISFAAFQLPLGLMLDRYGARRVHGALLLVAAAGAGVFAAGTSLWQLWLGRALIGLGVAGGLMAALKAITLWFPERRWPVVNGLFLATGGLGAMSATAPVELLLGVTSWRGVFVGLAAATGIVALAVFLVVPEKPRRGPPRPLREQVAGIRAIFADRFFWRLAPAAFLTMSTSLAIQGLWAGPWLRDVAGLAQPAVADTLFAMTAAMTLGFVFWGTLADRLDRVGIPLTATFGGGVALFLVVLLAITFQAATGILTWLAFGLMGNVAALAYTVLARHVPLVYAGRTNTALNLLVFLGAFAAQSAMGGILDLWPQGAGGGYPPAAYRAAFGTFTAVCIAAWVWYLLAARRVRLGETRLRPS
jgi:MFS family permease